MTNLQWMGGRIRQKAHPAGDELDICTKKILKNTDRCRNRIVNAVPNQEETTDTNVFPWMETGPTPGSVGIVWYGTVDGNDDFRKKRPYLGCGFCVSSLDGERSR